MSSVVLLEVSPGKCSQLRHLKASRTSSGWVYGVFVLNLILLIILIIKNVLLKQVVISSLFALFMFPAYLCFFIMLLNLKRNSSEVSMFCSWGVWPGGLRALALSLLGTVLSCHSCAVVLVPAGCTCACSEALCWCRGRNQPHYESVFIVKAVWNYGAPHSSVLKHWIAGLINE